MTDIKPKYIQDTDYNLKVAYNTRFSKKNKSILHHVY